MKYLFLAPYTFFWHNPEAVLLYNSLNGAIDIIDNDTELNGILSRLDDIREMYCVPFNGNNSSNVASFVEKVMKNGYGGLVNSENGVKPIVLPPRLAILETPKSGSNYLGLLKVLTITLIGSNYIDPSLKRINHNNQADSINAEKSVLPWSDLKKLLSELPSTIDQLIITGTDILSYPDWEKLVNVITPLPSAKTIIVNLSVFQKIIESDFEFSNLFKIEVEIVMSSFNEGMEEIFNNAASFFNNFMYIFYISSEEEYERTELISEKYSLEQYEIRPLFDGNNIGFFERNVFLTEEDIKNQNISRREVFAHQTINTNYFGRLTVTSDGKIYANINMKPLGKIGDNLADLIKKEFSEGESWFRTRDVLDTCCKCLYRYLCPSPSDYELKIGQSNLCVLNTK